MVVFLTIVLFLIFFAQSFIEGIRSLFYGSYSEDTQDMNIPFSTVGKCQAFVPEVKDPQLDYPLLAASLMDFDTKYCSFDEPENRDPRRPNLFMAQCLNTERDFPNLAPPIRDALFGKVKQYPPSSKDKIKLDMRRQLMRGSYWYSPRSDLAHLDVDSDSEPETEKDGYGHRHGHNRKHRSRSPRSPRRSNDDNSMRDSGESEGSDVDDEEVALRASNGSAQSENRHGRRHRSRSGGRSNTAPPGRPRRQTNAYGQREEFTLGGDDVEYTNGVGMLSQKL